MGSQTFFRYALTFVAGSATAILTIAAIEAVNNARSANNVDSVMGAHECRYLHDALYGMESHLDDLRQQRHADEREQRQQQQRLRRDIESLRSEINIMKWEAKYERNVGGLSTPPDSGVSDASDEEPVDEAGCQSVEDDVERLVQKSFVMQFDSMPGIQYEGLMKKWTNADGQEVGADEMLAAMEAKLLHAS